MITKVLPINYNPDATCPHFESFLERIMEGDQGMILFLQKALGYSLSGSTNEQVWFFCHGNGQNGKSTLLNAISYVLGDYDMETPASTFLDQKGGDGPRNDLARLRGARFVWAVEPSQKQAFDESTLKRFTGQDQITCRFLHKEYFTFLPEAKLFFAASVKPSVPVSDFGFWRRIRLIPFEVTISEEEIDRSLPDRLKEEAEGILAWMVRGFFLYREEGLIPPDKVRNATAEYQDDSDPLSDFLNERCELSDESITSVKELYETYCQYCQKEKPISKNSFGRILTSKGFRKVQVGPRRTRHWSGIGLAHDGHSVAGDPTDDWSIDEDTDL